MPAPAVAQVSSPPQAAAGPTYTISELAREFDLTTRAIRFYEDCELISPQRNGRNRVYTARDRTRLKLTLRGKRLGLTLAEVKELVDMYESPRDTQPQLKKFLVVLAAHREQLEQQLADLHATLDEVRAHEKEARRLLAAGERKKVGA
jgi:DNA-binding transcriptional MerR regulator